MSREYEILGGGLNETGSRQYERLGGGVSEAASDVVQITFTSSGSSTVTFALAGVGSLSSSSAGAATLSFTVSGAGVLTVLSAGDGAASFATSGLGALASLAEGSSDATFTLQGAIFVAVLSAGSSTTEWSIAALGATSCRAAGDGSFICTITGIAGNITVTLVDNKRTGNCAAPRLTIVSNGRGRTVAKMPGFSSDCIRPPCTPLAPCTNKNTNCPPQKISIGAVYLCREGDFVTEEDFVSDDSVDLHWRLRLMLPRAVEIYRIEIFETGMTGATPTGQLWSTDTPVDASANFAGESATQTARALAVLENGVQKFSAFEDTLGTVAAGEHFFDLYGHYGTPIGLGNLFRVFVYTAEGKFAANCLTRQCRFCNEEQTCHLECPDGSNGVDGVVDECEIISEISVADANEQALVLACERAEELFEGVECECLGDEQLISYDTDYIRPEATLTPTLFAITPGFVSGSATELVGKEFWRAFDGDFAVSYWESAQFLGEFASGVQRAFGILDIVFVSPVQIHEMRIKNVDIQHSPTVIDLKGSLNGSSYYTLARTVNETAGYWADAETKIWTPTLTPAFFPTPPFTFARYFRLNFEIFYTGTFNPGSPMPRRGVPIQLAEIELIGCPQ